MAKPKPKNNKHKRWDALKTDYLAGDYKTLAEFARTNPIGIIEPSSGSFKLKTRGWIQAKKDLMHKVSLAVVEHIKVQKVVQNLNINERFQDATSQALTAIEDYLTQVQYKKRLVERQVPKVEIEIDSDGKQVIDVSTGEPYKKLIRDAEGKVIYDTEYIEVEAPIVDVHNIKKVFEAIDKGTRANIMLDRYITPPEPPECGEANLSEAELTTYQKWTKRLNR